MSSSRAKGLNRYKFKNTYVIYFIFVYINDAGNSDYRVSNEYMAPSNEMYRPCEVTCVAQHKVIFRRWQGQGRRTKALGQDTLFKK